MNDSINERNRIMPKQLLGLIGSLSTHDARVEAYRHIQNVFVDCKVIPAVVMSGDTMRMNEEQALRALYYQARDAIHNVFELPEGSSIMDSYMISHERDLEGAMLEILSSMDSGNLMAELLKHFRELPHVFDLLSVLNYAQRADVLCAVAAYFTGRVIDKESDRDDELCPTPDDIIGATEHDEVVQAAAMSLISGVVRGKYSAELLARMSEVCLKEERPDDFDGLTGPTIEREGEQKRLMVPQAFGNALLLDCLATNAVFGIVARKFTRTITGVCLYAVGKVEGVAPKALERYRSYEPNPENINVHNIISITLDMLDKWIESEIQRKLDERRGGFQGFGELLERMGLSPEAVEAMLEGGGDDDKEDDDGEEKKQIH